MWTGAPIDLTTGHANVIWQGDANAQVLRALRHVTTPAEPLNVSGPETVSIRWLAGAFAARMDREPSFTGTEAETAWLTNTSRAAALFGYPRISLDRMVDWTADWVMRGGDALGKPTHYDARDGSF